MIGSFCVKYTTFDLKKYRGVIFHYTEESCKIWRKADLWYGKWQEEFGKFSSGHLKVSKLVFSWDPFVQSRKCMSLKLREEVCYDNEEWYKIWNRIDLPFQNWHEEFNKFWPKHLKISKICTLIGCFWSKYVMFELKKV